MGRRTIGLLVLLAGSCGDDGGDDQPLPDLELQIVRWEDGDLLTVEPGTAIPLVNAPQGGHFFFVGARVKNLEATDVDMSAVVEDAATGAAIGAFVARPRMIPTQDGWFEPEHETFTTIDMVQVCPMGVKLDLDGRPVNLVLRVKEFGTDRTAATALEVRPDCGDSELCACECAADFDGSCP
jgi:hypothetical protein